MSNSADSYRIAALQKKQVMAADLMVSGSGIPWEDRGSLGLPSAFMKTLVGMLFSPIATLSRMRRPETTGDSNIFGYLCGLIWAVASAVQSAVAYWHYKNDPTFDSNQYWINTAVEAFAIGLLMAFLARLLGMMFYKLTSFDMATKAPPILIHNMVNYMMAVSILAIIPGGPNPYLQIGPVLAGLWFFIILLAVAIKRLRVKTSAGVIGAFVTTVGTVAVVTVVYLIVGFVWIKVLGFDAMPPAPIKLGNSATINAS